MSQSPRRGFTLAELIVVVAIIAVLIGLLLPATRRVREASARVKCMNNLKQIIFAIHTFESTGTSAPTGPPDAGGRYFPTGCSGPGAAPEDRLSWMVPLLPHLEQAAVWKQFDAEKGYEGNVPAAGAVVNTFLCPVADFKGSPAAVTHYVAMAGIGLDAAGRPAYAAGNGFMGYDRSTSFAMIMDGASNTLALMETRSGLGPWARGGASSLRGFDPADVPSIGDGRPFGGHAEGMNVAMADGSVRTLRASVEPRVLAAAVTIAGGEPVERD